MTLLLNFSFASSKYFDIVFIVLFVSYLRKNIGYTKNSYM